MAPLAGIFSVLSQQKGCLRQFYSGDACGHATSLGSITTTLARVFAAN